HGKIRDDYNIELLINCLDYIKTPVELWLVGGGPAENKMKELAKKSKHKVLFFGVQPYEKILKLIKKADICLQPLPTLSMKLWQYFAAGKPIVGVDGWKIREVVKNNVHAVLTKNDPKEYAKGIEKLIKNEKLRKKLIKNGLKLTKLVDWENIIKEYKKLLEKIIKNFF
ncbi:MAG: glycosyltransferase, partial [Candidatus Methanomethylicia archaeon]